MSNDSGNTAPIIAGFVGIAKLIQSLGVPVDALLSKHILPKGGQFGRDCKAMEIPQDKYLYAQFLSCMSSLCREEDPKFKEFLVVSKIDGGSSLQLPLYPGDGLSLFTRMSMDWEETSLQVMRKMQSGWQRAALRDYPHILHKQSEETHDLWICRHKVSPSFFSYASSLLGIGEMAHCYNAWSHGHPFENPRDLPVYLWIKKKHAAEVLAKLGISSSGA
jgi:hypothetical protein